MKEGLHLRGIAHRFGRRWVLRGIDTYVEPGEVIALTGRNGSGKTTLLRICATLLRPTRGSGTLAASDLVKDASAIRQRVGMLAHDAGLYGTLTAAENLAFSLRMASRTVDEAAVLEALDRVGLKHEANERVRGFSAGMRRRLALARLLLRPPALLLLDEPYASFDVDGIDLVNAFTAGIARAGGIVLVATHDLPRARPVMTRELRIEGGRFTGPGSQASAEADAGLAAALEGERG
jgi:heme exporter protein A